MKTFKNFLTEMEDPRADINIPYKTPEDIAKIMRDRGSDSDASPKEAPKKRSKAEENELGKERAKKRRENVELERNTSGEMTMDQVGKLLGISKQRVDQIEKDALDKILKGIETLRTDPSMQQAWHDVNRPKTKTRRIGPSGD